MKPTRSWIVIADGAQARILENHGPGKGLVALPSEAMHKTLRPSREINAERPGRTHDRMGPGRHAMEPPSDPHREEKRRFADLLADHLNAAALKHSYDRLVLVAEATASPQACWSQCRELLGVPALKPGCELVLVHPDVAANPWDTAAWLAQQRFAAELQKDSRVGFFSHLSPVA